MLSYLDVNLTLVQLFIADNTKQQKTFAEPRLTSPQQHTQQKLSEIFSMFSTAWLSLWRRFFFRWITCNDMANCGRMRIIKGEMMMEKCSIRQLKKMKRSRETDIESDLTFGWRRKGLTLFAAHLSVSHVSAQKNTEIHFFFPHFFHLQRFGEKRSKKNHTNYIWSDHRTLVNSYGNFFFNFCFLLKRWMSLCDYWLLWNVIHRPTLGRRRRNFENFQLSIQLNTIVEWWTWKKIH